MVVNIMLVRRPCNICAHPADRLCPQCNNPTCELCLKHPAPMQASVRVCFLCAVRFQGAS